MAFLVPPSAFRIHQFKKSVSRSARQPFAMKRTSPSSKHGPEPKDTRSQYDQGDSNRSSAPTPRSPEDMLLEDLKIIRAKQKAQPQASKSADSPMRTVKTAIDTLLLWDFFLVLGLLGWFAIALIPHFASKNDVLLDPWLALWQPFIQPVLGVLMLGTVVQGTMSFISKDS